MKGVNTQQRFSFQIKWYLLLFIFFPKKLFASKTQPLVFNLISDTVTPNGSIKYEWRRFCFFFTSLSFPFSFFVLLYPLLPRYKLQPSAARNFTFDKRFRTPIKTQTILRCWQKLPHSILFFYLFRALFISYWSSNLIVKRISSRAPPLSPLLSSLVLGFSLWRFLYLCARFLLSAESMAGLRENPRNQDKNSRFLEYCIVLFLHFLSLLERDGVCSR